MKPFDYLVDVKDLRVHRGGKVVLGKVNFSLSQGEFCYICGPTGSGKSTFLKALYGAVPIHSGSAVVMDHDLLALTPRGMPFYRRKLGILFQEINLLKEWNVYDNLDLALRATEWHDVERRRQRIDEVLRQVGLGNKSKVKVNELSGGERQLVALARSILNKPKLILADEPSGSLDSIATQLVMTNLVRLAKEYAASVVLCTHDQTLLDRFPGRIVACREGSFHE